MPDSITFPSASNMSKLSACPTTKLPQAADWILHDFFDTMLNGGDNLLTPSAHLAELLPKEKLADTTLNLLQSTFYDYEVWHDSNDNDCATLRDDQLSLPDLQDDSKNNSAISSSDEEDTMMIEDHNNGVTFQSDLTECSNVAPVLIESTISSSCTTVSSEDVMSFRQSIDTSYLSMNHTISKRKSTSSFSSFKSFMSAFHTSKKSKLEHHYPLPVPALTTPTPMVVMAQKKSACSLATKSSFSKRLLKYFKRR